MTNMKKSDFLAAIIAGFFTAIFIMPLLSNVGFSGSLNLKVFKLPIALLPVLIPVLWIVGLIMGNLLKRWVSFTYQFEKFVIVGFLNTAIDFGTLNVLSNYLGITSGFILGGVNIPGFILAGTNSYFWNKFWVFRKAGEPVKKDYSDVFKFIIVVVIGTFINSGIVIFLTTYMNPLGGMSPERWLNIAKATATAVSLLWNFFGLKLIVFKSKMGMEDAAEVPVNVSEKPKMRV